MKALKRIFFYLAIFIAAVLIGFIASAYFFKDRIIQQFVREANKGLSTPVKIGKIDISPWEDFPNMAITFSDVYIEDSHPGNYPLLTASQISFYLNPVEVWEGKYSIKGLHIRNSETFLKVNSAGNSNYIILKEKSDGNEANAVSFDLKNVRIHNAKVYYNDLYRNQDHSFTTEQLIASIDASGYLYKISARGDVGIEQIGVRNNKFLQEKNFDVIADLVYDDEKKLVSINPSQLNLHESKFELSGSYGFNEKNIIDIQCNGQNTSIQTLISLMPEKITKQLERYESQGDVYFNLSLKGEISSTKGPALSIHFGCSETTVFHPEYVSRIENANLKGSFTCNNLSNLASAHLMLSQVSGNLNGKFFQTDLSIEDFINPYVKFQFKGDLEAASITNFYPIPELTDLSGEINIDVLFEGETAMLKKKSTAQKVKTSGTVDMNNLNFKFGQQKIQFADMNGQLQFTNNDLALSDVKGKLENTDFLLNGFFKNIVTFLIFEDQPIGIETDLKSKFVDLDQLFKIGFGQAGSSEFNFSISPNLHLNFNCNVKSMHYKRFKPKNISGNLLIKNQTAVARNVEFDAMGGHLTVNGIVDAQNNKAIDIINSFKVKDIHLDSVFYVFENFNQDFIQDMHLKGLATADVDLEMTLNEKLRLFQETLIANISTTISQGELNNFEPLHRLDRYLDDEGLNRLRFADLTNNIHIEGKTVYIPQMEVRSNVTNIQISGTHTFDQHIDYRVTAPLRNKKKIDPDEAFGAIEDDGRGQSKIFLRITGTTENYKVVYDKESVKKKIVSDLNKEVKELKDAFKLKGKLEKKEIELEEDDYFEWSDSTQVKKNNE